MAPATNSGLGGAESLKVNQWNVDNLRIDGNTFSTTDTNGDLILDPNGTGRVIISDDTSLSFGSDGDSSIEYDENGDNKVKVTGASWVYSNSVEFTSDSRFGDIKIKDNIISTVPGSGNIMYIDPHPDDLSSEGTLVIKGSLRIDGETTSINSTNLTSNSPFIHLGDLQSLKQQQQMYLLVVLL